MGNMKYISYTSACHVSPSRLRTMAVWAVLAIFFAGCEKELDFKYHDIPPIPVMEAQLTPEGARLGITFTTPMDEPMDLQRFTDAEVSLTDLTSGAEYRLTADSDGYFTDAAPGITGHKYRLDIIRKGIRYTTSTMMYGPVEILSTEFSWIRMPYDDVAVLQCRYTDNTDSEGEYYWVRVYRNDEIYMWSEQSDRTAEEGVMNFFAMTSRRDLDEEDEDTALRDGDVITVSVCAISRTMHDYLEALGNDSSGPRLFTASLTEDMPDADMDPDLKERLATGCLGYFMASSPVSSTLVFHPDEIPMATDR